MLVSEYKADLNARNKDNNTPVHIAASNGHSDVIKCLLDEFNVKPTVKGCKGRNILHTACTVDCDTSVTMLTCIYDMFLLS